MANRKTGKELRAEYREHLDKTKAMQRRFLKRADELIKRYPDVIYCKKVYHSDEMITVSQYKRFYKITPQSALSIIEKIEEHIASLHPHQQLNMFK